MSPAIFRILEYGSSEYREAVALRESVLRAPLGRRFSPEELAQEKNHIHVAGFINAAVCATAVLVPEGSVYKMQRVAVAPAEQGKGLGLALMLFCEAYASERGIREIYCHARDTAVAFYLKHAYGVEGEPFDEDGIPHLKMRKSLQDR